MASSFSLPCHYTKKRYFQWSWEGRGNTAWGGGGARSSQEQSLVLGAFPTLPQALWSAWQL